ncbi:MAG: hypothetical protein OES69_14580 [Myxococcales bacterium]|nr:hypothetical protein [Myxococcales bacterium]
MASFERESLAERTTRRLELADFYNVDPDDPQIEEQVDFADSVEARIGVRPRKWKIVDKQTGLRAWIQWARDLIGGGYR